MTWAIFLGIAALISFLIAVITPIVKLNTAITKLTISVETLNTNMGTTEKRITKHGEEIDGLKNQVTKLESEQKSLKEKVEFFHHN